MFLSFFFCRSAGSVTVLDAGLIVFFLVYTFVFSWVFDRVFGLPASALPQS